MDSLNFNLINIIIFSGVVHGIIFSAILFLKRKLRSRTNCYLGFTILSLVGSNLQYWLFDVGFIDVTKYSLYIPFEFLMLPFFYIYVKNYLNKRIGFIEKLLLFSLFYLIIGYQLLANIFTIQIEIIEVLNLFIQYSSTLFTFGIIGIIFRIILSYERDFKTYNGKIVVVKTGWLKNCLFLGLLLCFIWFISTNYLVQLGAGYSQYYPLWIGISILVYWMAYVSLFQTSIYDDRINIRKKLVADVRRVENDYTSPKSFEKLAILISGKKLYLNPDFNLHVLSLKTNFSKGYISQLFSSNNDLNFNVFINNLRIEESKKMLHNLEYNNYTIIAIGLEAGFNSKSSFYSAFKKFTGMTPLQYKKNVRYN